MGKKNKQNKEVITHPENLIVNSRYSVTVEFDGVFRRLAGRMICIETCYTTNSPTKPAKSELVIGLSRMDNLIWVPWLKSKNWVNIS